ncbi:hypothetical protein LWI28_020466 [Acer negundo]|uniref:non-specific serine/threonine protein kinase n=1 Tax=Acer negundo TaxID=4023 RepID=A0AAD5NXA7_ACENE|nr:hypothetical protein LWI28_020466 [Acer negundo]
MAGFTMLIIYFFLLSYITITTTLSLDTIALGQSLKDGEKLVSAGNVFEMGFFRPGKSRGRYLGIWYKKDGEKSVEDTVAWVANRNNPISDSSGFLSINAQGSLVLRMNSTNNIVWSSSNASTTLQNPVAVLLQSGNLVVKDGNDSFLWQSFDYPCNTFLPGMKIGRNLVTGMEWFLSSWKSIDDPAPGDFTFQVDPHGFPQLFVKKGPKKLYRAGSWNGLRWTGTPYLETNPVYTYEFVSNEKEVFYTIDIRNISVPTRMVMSSSGYLLPSNRKDQNWERFSVTEVDRCEFYDLCGSYASCDINKSPDVCECLERFAPKSPGHWTEGCVRRAPLHCNHSDGFLKHEEVKLPDTSHSWVDNNISLPECKKLCLSNCSCTAYANSDVREGGTGCLLWLGDLFDIKKLELHGQDLYVRVDASELDNIDLMRQPIARRRQLSEKKRVIIIVTCVVSTTGVLVLGWIIFMCKRKFRIQGKTDNGRDINDNNEESKTDDMELLIYDLNTIAKATDNFADKNKLGEGGFGPVYKGTLMEGQEIAIKRLSKCSGQGIDEFKNESIKDGETLVSAGGTFELSFFSPGNSTRRYLGIRYKVDLDKTVAWVANRETSLTDHSGVLNVTQQGILVLLDGMNRIIWSSNTSRTAKNPVVQLLKSGNLVVKDGNGDDPGNFLWQSFDHPTDNLLPGMKLGRNFVTGLDTYLSSWKTSEDPAPGQFSLWIDPHGFPQLVLRNGSALRYRAGSRNFIRFTGTPRLNLNPEFLYRFELNKDEQGSLMSRLFLSQSSLIQLLVRLNQSKVWTTVYDAPEDQCEIYSFCGAHAACKTDSNSSVCVCLDGFEPKSPEEWRRSNWSKGCVRMTELNCEKGDEFRNYTGLKLPDTSNSTFNTSMSLQECEEKCLKNCSCTAYANSNIGQEGSGCLLWFGNLTDMIQYSEGGQNFYIRMAAKENDDGNANVKKRIGIVGGSVILIAMLLVGLIFYIHKRKHKKQGIMKRKYKMTHNDGEKEEMDLWIFDFNIISKATDNFSNDNKLGEGGFGLVYKGILTEGQEIANNVMFYSKSSVFLKVNCLTISYDQSLFPIYLFRLKLINNIARYLSSWKSSVDLAPGQFSLWIDPRGFPQLVLRNGSALRYRVGSWNGIRFTGTPKLNPNQEFLYPFELNKDEVYYKVDDQGLLMSRLFLNQSGFIQLPDTSEFGTRMMVFFRAFFGQLNQKFGQLFMIHRKMSVRFIRSVAHTLLARLIAAVLYVLAWMDLNQNHQKSGECQIGLKSVSE